MYSYSHKDWETAAAIKTISSVIIIKINSQIVSHLIIIACIKIQVVYSKSRTTFTLGLFGR